MDPQKLPYNPGRFAAVLLVLFMLIAAGCSESGSATALSGATSTPPLPGKLTPYRTSTATITPTPPDPSTPTPLPSPTPTPQAHTVVKGEDLFGIALRYGISLEELRAANPDVNPNFLSIGTVLVIPLSKTPQPSSQPAAPTPVPLELSAPHCFWTESKGVWCFLQARNMLDRPLESVSAIIRLTGSQAQEIVAQMAFLPLDVLPPGASMPLYAYYAPETVANLSGTLRASAELMTALPNPDDGRYLKTLLENTTVTIDENGLAADIQVNVSLEAQDYTAQRLWVAATAYDSNGQVIGVRRWEMPSGETLGSRAQLPVAFRIYSVSGAIDRIEVFAEARP